MIWESRWVVLVPGEAKWVEKRTRELLEELDPKCVDTFIVIPGRERYQAIVAKGPLRGEPEGLLGDAFSRELDQVVYAIEGREEYPEILSFLKGEETELRRKDPERLVRSLGCTLPWFDQPPPNHTASLLKGVTLVQGVGVMRIRKALDREAGRPLPPGTFRIEETPLGVLLTDGISKWRLSGNYLAERFPRATVYTVIASSDLDFFVVSVTHKRKRVEFWPPPEEPGNYPVIDEVLGEREPERILAAMGIPKEWFRL